MLRMLLRTVLGLGVLLVLVIGTFLALMNWPLPAPPAPPAAGDLALIGVTVIDLKTGLRFPDQTVIVREGRIASVGDRDAAPLTPDLLPIDADGAFVMPALWDMHVHIGSELAPLLSLPLFIAAGVTNVREMGGQNTVGLLASWDADARAGNLVGPRIAAHSGALVFNPDPELDPREIVAHARRNRGFIKTFNGINPAYYPRLLAAARSEGVAVLGHRPRAVSALDAVRAGHLSFEHARLFLFECYPGAAALRERYRAYYTGESVETDRIDNPTNLRRMLDEFNPALFDTLTTVMVEHGTWYCPTHITRKMDALADDPVYRNDDRLRFINYAQRWEWNRDADRVVARYPDSASRHIYKEFHTAALNLTGRAHEAGVQILAGTDANDTMCFPGLGLHEELGELVEAGLSPLDALRAATIEPARYCGLQEEFGAIAVGMVADMIVLSADPLVAIENIASLEGVVCGSLYYDAQAIDELKGYVERVAANPSVALRYGWSTR